MNPNVSYINGIVYLPQPFCRYLTHSKSVGLRGSDTFAIYYIERVELYKDAAKRERTRKKIEKHGPERIASENRLIAYYVNHFH